MDVIHPELHHDILRPIMKELAQYDLLFLCYGKKAVPVCHFFKWQKSTVLSITKEQ